MKTDKDYRIKLKKAILKKDRGLDDILAKSTDPETATTIFALREAILDFLMASLAFEKVGKHKPHYIAGVVLKEYHRLLRMVIE